MKSQGLTRREELMRLHDQTVCELAMLEIAEQTWSRIEEEIQAPECAAAYDGYAARTGAKTRKRILGALRKNGAKHAVRRAAPRMLRAAAAVLAVFYVSLTVAIAAVPVVRVQVIRLLYSVHERYTELRLVEEDAFEAPAGWTGAYFPAYIPEGFVLREITNDRGGSRKRAVFEHPGHARLEFTERNPDAGTQIDTEDAVVEWVMIRDEPGQIATKNGTHTVSWAHPEHYFVLLYDGAKEEAIQIAESLLRVR